MSAPLPYKNIVVIANPIAGKGKGRTNATELAELLRAEGAEVELFFTGARFDAEGRARELSEDIDLVCVCGGDGTVAEVLSGLQREVPIAVLPMGTANVLSLDLALPRKPAGLLEIIRGGHTTRMEVASVNGRLSFLVTGVGIDGEVVTEVERRRSGPITKLLYLRCVLAVLWRYRAPRLTVTIDGEQQPGHYALVFVSNIIRYGGFMKLDPQRLLNDGLYEVYLFPEGSRFALVRVVLRGVLGHLPGGSCRMVRAAAVKIESAEPVHYQVDGDFGGQTPVEIHVTPDQYELLVPKPA
jgi:diacylglycerol kinase (ATP)